MLKTSIYEAVNKSANEKDLFTNFLRPTNCCKNKERQQEEEDEDEAAEEELFQKKFLLHLSSS